MTVKVIGSTLVGRTRISFFRSPVSLTDQNKYIILTKYINILIIMNCIFRSKGFDLKWVDDTHALGVFSSYIAGGCILQLDLQCYHCELQTNLKCSL